MEEGGRDAHCKQINRPSQGTMGLLSSPVGKCVTSRPLRFRARSLGLTGASRSFDFSLIPKKLLSDAFVLAEPSERDSNIPVYSSTQCHACLEKSSKAECTV